MPEDDRPENFRQIDESKEHIVRFSPLRRSEHALVIVTFVLLLLTGFPQRFYESGWASTLLGWMGGLDTARTIHRVAGFVFVAHSILHVLGFIIGVAMGRMRLTLMPTPQDLRDAWQNLRYYLGYRSDPPRFPKFDYRQKFEYIGIILGGMVMIVSGLVLYFPAFFATWLPGQIIPAARVAHSNEAMLAFLVLLIWHAYGSHMSPEVFPMDTSIFTGKMTVEELRERHRLEYARLYPDRARAYENLEAPPATVDDPPQAELAREPEEIGSPS